MSEDPRLELAGAAYIAPPGTPPPGPFQVLHAHVTADGTRVVDEIAPLDPLGPPLWRTDEGPVGPPIPVVAEQRPDGVYVQGSIGPAHPAYAELRAGLTQFLSVVDEAADFVSDNEPYVVLDPVRGGSPIPSPAVPVASPPVNGLGREHIDRRRHVPPPASIGLGDAVAALFGARLTDDPEQPVARVTGPNRAQRRAAARQGRRKGTGRG